MALAPSTPIQIDGLNKTTIRWGTTGVYANNSGAIVLDVNQAQDVEKIYLENGDGLRATRIMLLQGVTTDFTVQDDATYFTTPPKIGDTVVVRNVIGTNGANVANITNYTYQATIVDNNVRLARKQEGHRVIRVENLTLIEGGS